MPESLNKEDKKRIENEKAIQKAEHFLTDFKEKLSQKNIQATEEEINNLKQRLISYFKKNNEIHINLEHAILLLWRKKGNEDEYEFPDLRKKYLGLFTSSVTNQHIDILIKEYDEKLHVDIKRKNVEMQKKLSGLELMHTTAEDKDCKYWKLFKVSGNREERKKIFEQVTFDMGNCIGGSHLDLYLDRTEKNIEIYLMRDGNDKFQVAIEYDKSTQIAIKIAGNTKKNAEEITEDNIDFDEFLDCVCVFVEKVKPQALRNIEHLEDKGDLEGKVITRHGKFLDRIDKTGKKISDVEIIFPARLFTDPIEIIIPQTKSRLSKEEIKNFYISFQFLESKFTTQQSVSKEEIDYWMNISRKVKVQISSDFKKIEFMTSNKFVYYEEVIKILGIKCGKDGSMNQGQRKANQNKIFTLGDIYELIKKQSVIQTDKPGYKEIRPGLLLTNRNLNVFAVESVDSKVCFFGCLWDPGNCKWILYFYPPNNNNFKQFGLPSNSRVFLPTLNI